MKAVPNELFFSWVEEEMAEGRSVRIRLKGNSMFPLLRDGRDEVFLYPCEGKEIKPMDVVLFRYRGMHVLHRVIRREGQQLYLQGDGVFVSRETCTTADVIGVMKQVKRSSGRVVDVDGWRWRLPSYLWRALGILRRPLLRLAYRFSFVRVI